MSAHEESRMLRLDIETLRQDADRLSMPQADMGYSVVVQTSTKTTYPTAAGAYYYCQVCRVGGVEREGYTGVVTPVPNRFLYAFNIGNAIPPAGTPVIVHARDGRWVFSYCGTP